ncbi:MAG: lipopolysaccharide biosynthesis protein [Muribaculaceae bacterium]|nr:lipopolysaccharide biosynthesis protein [Muribaculaceae bacterium]
MADLKLMTARTLKWNAIDRVASQVLYAVVGIVLANILSHEEFGLVGALAIFQAFATIFVDSGFGAALLREKSPTDDDYSTVFWFNAAVSVAIYLLLFLSAPLIARLFHDQRELIPMSKVMFLTFVINGLAIVQTNRLMKRMDVRMIAVSNTVALIASGVIGVMLAIMGFGAWAMVWYAVSQAAVKTGILWATGGWRPRIVFKMATIRRIRGVGISVLSSSLLNTISLNVYNFVIGIWYSLAALGVYTQADKWSKMGSASISQILTSTFVPLLSKVQDSSEDFHRYTDRAGRFTAFILLPAMTLLAIMANPLFHLLFGHKWDAAIPLFSILAIRGIFVVLISLYSNYLLALGRARKLFISETVKDTLILLAILATVTWADIDVLVFGQFAASLLTWLILLPVTARGIGMSAVRLLRHLLPFLCCTAAAAATALLATWMTCTATDGIFTDNTFTSRIIFNGMLLLIQIFSFTGTYFLALRLFRIPELPEALGYLLGRFMRRRP